MDEHNDKKLFETHNKCNPVARITSKTIIGKNRKSNHFDDKRGLQNVLYITRNAKVEIKGKNICPEWGLFNGSIGTVKDIVFHQNETPQSNLPAYVLVDFPLYCGPIMSNDYPTLVPILPVETDCQFKCCRRKQIPLGLAFGKTAHTVQGANVGKEKPGQPKNPFLSAVFNLGDYKYESCWPGLTYTCVSRGTTLGTADDNLSSSVYFTGNWFPPSRFQDLHLSPDKKIYQKYAAREKWLSYLKSNLHKVDFSIEQKLGISTWFSSNPINTSELETILS